MKWDLSELGDLKNINKDIEEIRKLTSKIEKYKNVFNENISSKDFLKILNDVEKLTIKISSLSGLVSLKFSEDTRSTKYQSLISQIDHLNAEINNKLLFISIEFKKFSEKNAKRIINSLENHRHYLQKSYDFRKYILAEDVEKVINLKDVTGVNALSSMYDVLTNDFKFDFEGKKITQEELMRYSKDPSEKRRKEVYESLFKVYKENKSLISLMYINIVGNWKNEIELRGYKSPISIRNKGNDLEDKDLEILFKVYKKNANVFRDYFKIKAKELGVKKLKRYDIYAPLSDVKKEFSFNEAQKIVLDSFKDFPEYVKGAKDILKNHVDSEVKDGKRSGAFCSSPHVKIKPYILLSFTNDLRSIETLAHELGHGIHSVLSSKVNNEYSFYPVLPMAETASTFCENLWFDYMKKKYPELKKYLVFNQLDGTYATIARQFNFTFFEIEAHELVKKGGSADDLEELYFKILKEHFGNSVELSDDFRYEYLYIPHIYHTPFYCYAYGFGLLLSLSLYKMYLEDNNFKKEIIKIFESGGNDSPRNILKKSGIDMNEEFWQKGFDYLKSLIDELK